MSSTPCIGIFDSGIGGFSVLDKVRKVTSANILYFGDCARAPYGNRDQEEIRTFIKEILLTLKRDGATHFISACNSMSVLTTDVLLEECGISREVYIDMSRAIAKFIGLPYSSDVLVIGTHATIASGVYRDVLESRSHRVIDYPLTDLASLIENSASPMELRNVITKVLLYAKEVEATHILYACTHYPLVDALFQKVQNEVEWRGTFIDPSIYVATHAQLWGLVGDNKTLCTTSKDTKAFLLQAKQYT